MASDYTDGFALMAIKSVFKHLSWAYKNRAKGPEARIKMVNASCLVGIAFANTFLGDEPLSDPRLAPHPIWHGQRPAVHVDLQANIMFSALPRRWGTFPSISIPTSLSNTWRLPSTVG